MGNNSHLIRFTLLKTHAPFLPTSPDKMAVLSDKKMYKKVAKRFQCAHLIIEARHLFCACLFRKRTDGSLRRMHFRYDPETVPDQTEDDLEYATASGLFVVEDFQLRQPRTINLDGVRWIKAGSHFRSYESPAQKALRGDKQLFDEPGVEELRYSPSLTPSPNQDGRRF